MAAAMRQSEFDKLSAALDRAEFAFGGIAKKKAVELHHRRNLAKSPEEIAALNLDAKELLKQMRKISEAVHSGNPAPISGWSPIQSKGYSWTDGSRRREGEMLKSGKIPPR
jgi:hypothetical protein